MPRLVNSLTGVTVDVDDETAANLTGDWSPEKKVAAKDDAGEKPARRTRASS